MPSTSLTVGGFNQPSVARNLIELPGNAEKGLSQRFLWLIPKPVYGKFDSLEPIDKTFTQKIGNNRISFFTMHFSGAPLKIVFIRAHDL
jgi:hypothetical protein